MYDNFQVKVMNPRLTIHKAIFTVIIFSLLIAFTGCSSQKDVSERRNFMMPKKSEMPKNSRYKEPAKRKTNKTYASKSKNKSLF
jgi:hypothetical protein